MAFGSNQFRSGTPLHRGQGNASFNTSDPRSAAKRGQSVPYGINGGGPALGVSIILPSYTVATLPAVSPAGQMVYCSNESGGAVPVFSDGTNWRRVTDRIIAS